MATCALRFVFFLAALGLLVFLAGTPLLVEEGIRANQWVAILGIFFLWAASAASWGRFFLRKIQTAETSFGLALALGFLFFAFVAFALGAAGLLLGSLRWLLLGICALGLALELPHLGKLPRPSLARLLRLQSLFLLPILLLVLLPGIDALYLHSFWDPLHHHLVGPRLWWESQRIYFPTNYVGAYQEGGFELLFLWPHFFFAAEGGRGLLPVQIFSQLAHFTAYVAALSLGWQLAWGKEFRLRCVALALFASPAALLFAIPTAKNDWGIIVWVLAGFVLLLQAKGRSAFLCCGLLWGMAVLGKFTAVFAVGGLGLAWVVFSGRADKNFVKSMGFLGLGFFLGALPLLTRNFLGTGNPFFPLLAEIFPTAETALGPTWREAFLRYQEGPGTEIPARVKEWAKEVPLTALLVSAPFLLQARQPRSLRITILGLLVGAVAFFLLSGPATEIRLLGGILPLTGLLVGPVLFLLSGKGPKLRRGVEYVALGILLVALPFRWDALRRMSAIATPEQSAQTYVSAGAQAWFRAQFQPGQKAATLVESRLYHSLPYPIVRLWDAPNLDRKLRATQTMREFFQVLEAEGVTHLILSQERLDLFYPKELVNQVEAYVFQHPKSILFETPMSMVADVKTLAK